MRAAVAQGIPPKGAGSAGQPGGEALGPQPFLSQDQNERRQGGGRQQQAEGRDGA